MMLPWISCWRVERIVVSSQGKWLRCPDSQRDDEAELEVDRKEDYPGSRQELWEAEGQAKRLAKPGRGPSSREI